MENEFIPYQQSLELKELGFDEPCFAFYNYNGQLCRYMNPDKDWNSLNHQQLKNSKITLPDTHTAPTYQQSFRWFREKYNLHPAIYPIKQHWECDIRYTNKDVNSSLHTFENKFTYEEAELTCLIKLIEIVKNEK